MSNRRMMLMAISIIIALTCSFFIWKTFSVFNPVSEFEPIKKLGSINGSEIPTGTIAKLCQEALESKKLGMRAGTNVEPGIEPGVYKCGSVLKHYANELATDGPKYRVYDFQGKHIVGCYSGGYPVSMRAEMWPSICDESCESTNLCSLATPAR